MYITLNHTLGSVCPTYVLGVYIPVLVWHVGECMVPIININNGIKNLAVGIKTVILVILIFDK